MPCSLVANGNDTRLNKLCMYMNMSMSISLSVWDGEGGLDGVEWNENLCEGRGEVVLVPVIGIIDYEK